MQTETLKLSSSFPQALFAGRGWWRALLPSHRTWKQLRSSALVSLGFVQRPKGAKHAEQVKGKKKNQDKNVYFTLNCPSFPSHGTQRTAVRRWAETTAPPRAPTAGTAARTAGGLRRAACPAPSAGGRLPRAQAASSPQRKPHGSSTGSEAWEPPPGKHRACRSCSRRGAARSCRPLLSAPSQPPNRKSAGSRTGSVKATGALGACAKAQLLRLRSAALWGSLHRGASR